MIRRAIVVLAAVAVVLGVIAWRTRSDGIAARFRCPAHVGSRLPPRGAPPSPDAPAAVAVVEVADRHEPLGLSTRPGDPALYVAEKGGKVVRVAGGVGATVLDLSDEVSTGTEQGLLGLAFSPDGAKAYTNHTDVKGDTRLTEWRVAPDGFADRREVLFVDQPHRWHNGGSLAFGPDGMLYAGLGDGGGQLDEFGNAQDLASLLGKVLRIDPRPSGGRPYSVPDDNPFVGRDGARPEVWAYGLRNPWRLTFDAETGDLWIADVGEGCFEELDFQRAGVGGANYGWPRTEGEWVADGPVPDDYAKPIYSYFRDGATICAVVGGYVYRGTAIPELRGWYVFGDLCHGQLMAWEAPGRGQPVPLGQTVNGLSSFGVDQAGELFAVSLVGEVYKVVPAPGAAG